MITSHAAGQLHIMFAPTIYHVRAPTSLAHSWIGSDRHFDGRGRRHRDVDTRICHILLAEPSLVAARASGVTVEVSEICLIARTALKSQ